ncbi:Beta-1,4-galactosyltransferase 7 [Orchesella cincta]|uniref:Beta-1,4-N-acetylgalactosaminyltransferase n=1 Tax=Orchesella cincta TaxID=48709 RepID=A0A1D2NJW4_ORCCI|nr:Beta-1,4-galactosyltransferase 7 [Orchesella cincta]
MAWRLIWRLRKLLALAVLACFLIAIYLGSSSMPKSYKNSDGRGKFFATNLPFKQLQSLPSSENADPIDETHHLGVIVPYRDRFEELLTFVPYIHRYLQHKKISHEIIVVNQVNHPAFISFSIQKGTGISSDPMLNKPSKSNRGSVTVSKNGDGKLGKRMLLLSSHFFTFSKFSLNLLSNGNAASANKKSPIDGNEGNFGKSNNEGCFEGPGLASPFRVLLMVDGYRFNRASLINAGFLYATSEERQQGGWKPCDYIAMHDVDLLPLNYGLPYQFPGDGSVMHVAAPGLHPKYNYPTFIGGILLVPVADFLKVNGMSNVYWGWGMEDDEFYVRLKYASIEVKRPDDMKTDNSNTFRHTHSPKVRPRDTAKCYDQFNKTKRRDRLTGLNNLNYTLLSTTHMTIDEAPLVLLNVRLQCDITISPWCDCSHNPSSSAGGKTRKKGSNNQNKKSSKDSYIRTLRKAVRENK